MGALITWFTGSRFALAVGKWAVIALTIPALLPDGHSVWWSEPVCARATCRSSAVPDPMQRRLMQMCGADVNTDVLKASPGADTLPERLEIAEVLAFEGACDDPWVVLARAGTGE